MAEHTDESLAAEYAALEAEFETKRAAAFESKLRNGGKFDAALLADRNDAMNRLGAMRTYWKEIGHAQQNGAPGYRPPWIHVSVANNDGSVAATEG